MSTTKNKYKYKWVEVQTANGPVKLKFYQIPDMTGPEENICSTRCPYRKVCEQIPDPRDLKNPEKSFIDFCGELGGDSTEDPEMINCVPVKGTLEQAFGSNMDVFKVLIERDPMVHLKDVINSVCQGWCDNYNEEFSNCNECNATCILHNLFLAKDKIAGGQLEKDPEIQDDDDDFLKLTEEIKAQLEKAEQDKQNNP